ncbi:MAG: ribonuclease HII [Candidatus Acididesulfobacter diazotrophicus]|jgi:ribonuclease HII|uniref:Ribonuclease HII n=1 Tax=Candidatus Acididesulfobacter diazotrophicus TaxID=2597226 RepID=A0A519BLN7_9DELT|nr:MAG: ribonuclease HII [Candidatus Acididesulfobacter diazotrophicus]
MKVICGIDEVGRGCLAGPVISAAIIIDKNLIPYGIKDSKLLTPEKREYFFDYLIENAISISIGATSNVEIDEINILNAAMLSMERAFNNLTVKPDIVIIDGPYIPKQMKNLDKIKVFPVIKADIKVKSVSCASIIAKVTRDKIMREYYDKKYHGYGFKNHKGYATKEHIENILKLGLTDIHRKTFKFSCPRRNDFAGF